MKGCIICGGGGPSLRCQGLVTCWKKVHDACAEEKGGDWVCEECKEEEAREEKEAKGVGRKRKAIVLKGERQRDMKRREREAKKPKKASSKLEDGLRGVVDRVFVALGKEREGEVKEIAKKIKHGEYDYSKGAGGFFADLAPLYLGRSTENAVRGVFRKYLDPLLVVNYLKTETGRTGELTPEQTVSLVSLYVMKHDDKEVLNVPASVKKIMKHRITPDITSLNELNMALRHTSHFLNQVFPDGGKLSTAVADALWWIAPAVRRKLKLFKSNVRMDGKLKWVLTEGQIEECRKEKTKKKEKKEVPGVGFGFTLQEADDTPEKKTKTKKKPPKKAEEKMEQEKDIIPENLYTAMILPPPEDDSEEDDDLPAPDTAFELPTLCPLEEEAFLQPPPPSPKDTYTPDPNLSYDQEVCERLLHGGLRKNVLGILAVMLPPHHACKLLNAARGRGSE